MGIVESNRIKAAFGLTKTETDANIEAMTSNFATKVSEAVGSGVYSLNGTSISVPDVQTDEVPSTTAPSTDEGKDSKARIVGLVIGVFAVLFIGGCCVIACCYVRRRQR